jgi:hypothetical protein
MLKILLVGILLSSLAGCASVKAFYESPHPGLFEMEGGQVQLLYSNPNNEQPGGPDQPRFTGSQQSTSSVYGGLGLMGIWKF